MVNGYIVSLTTQDFQIGLLIRFKENKSYNEVEYFLNKTKVKLISQLMNSVKWLPVTISPYSCTNAGTHAYWNRV